MGTFKMDARETRYSAYRESYKLTFELAGEHAKWLLSTLMLLNSGAIAGIFQKEISHRNFVVSVFALGVLLALTSGTLAWFNLQWAASYYSNAAADILAEKEPKTYPWAISQSRTWAVYVAFGSIGCLAAGAILTALFL
jgi:hypothetical protein